jgi:hypothetical protein
MAQRCRTLDEGAAMTRAQRVVLIVHLFVALLGAAIALSQHGRYGWTLFVMVPLLAGAVSVWSLQPQTALRAAGVSSVPGFAGCALFLLLGREGFICVLMALPVVVPLSVIGGLIAYWGSRLVATKSPVAMCLLIPVSMGFDLTAKPPVYAVTTQIVVNAPPERVWKYAVAFPDISARPDWILRTGLAYPVRTEIDGSGVGVPRYCVLSTGTVKERVTAWNEPYLLQFAVTETPPAMKETGLYGTITPKHISGYYISQAGQFTLTRLPGDRTLLVGTSWYQHGLWPAEYWRLWSDTVVHHIHQRVLEHIRDLSEKDG